MVPAVVLSSHTMGLSIIRSLGSAGVPVHVFYYDKKDMGYVSKYVKGRIYTPHPEKNENDFIDVLLKQGKKLGRSLLFPADDATLKTVSKNKNVLLSHYIVTCPEWDVVKAVIEKNYTYKFVASLDIPMPKTLVPKSREEVEDYSKKIEFPCVLKPCQSHLYYEAFKKKLVKVNNRDELLSAYSEAQKGGIDILLQEYIPGSDSNGVNYNSLRSNGRCIVEFTAEKCRLGPPECGVPRVVKSKYIPELSEPGRKILEAMGYNGYSCIEFKKDDRDGIYKFMEINGRYNRSGLLALKCGLNIPLFEYNLLTEAKIPYISNYKEDVYWIDGISDVVNSIKYFRKERYSLKEYIAPYLKDHIFAIVNLKDPIPLMKRIKDLFRMVLVER